jgi:hypothetical protein
MILVDILVTVGVACIATVLVMALTKGRDDETEQEGTPKRPSVGTLLGHGEVVLREAVG